MMRYRLAAEFDGGEQLTWHGVALMLGITAVEVLDALGESRDAHDLPAELQKLGRRRSAQARAYCDSENAAALMFYWAHQQWGERISLALDTDARELWLSTDDPEAVAFFFTTETTE